MARDGIIQVRVDTRLKQQAEELFTDLGLDTASAIRMFLKQSVMYQGIPFPVVRQQPYTQTLQTGASDLNDTMDQDEVNAIINDMDIDL